MNPKYKAKLQTVDDMLTEINQEAIAEGDEEVAKFTCYILELMDNIN